MLVLVIDDSRTIRTLLSFALKEMGATEVLEADCAEKAEAILRVCFNIDLIITDWHMPGMSGLDLLKRLRAQPRFAATPIILSTSESGGDNVVAALRAGATNYIIKPFGEAQLKEKVGPFIKAAKSSPSSAGLISVSQSGTLNEGELANVIQFFIHSAKTGCCDIECSQGRAQIYFRDGHIRGACYGDQKGENAFYACFRDRATRYRFREETIVVPEGCAIAINNMRLLIEAAATRDRSANLNG